MEREYGTQDPQEPQESREPHGAVSGGQAALAVIVVAGIGLTALLLRPDAPLTAPGRGPLGNSAGLVLLLALACLLAVLAARHRYRDRLDESSRLSESEQRLSDTVRQTLAVLTFALPLLVLVLHRFGTRHGGGRGQKPAPIDTGSLAPTSTPTRQIVGHAPYWVPYAVAAVGALIVLALVAFAARFLWQLLRHRPVRGRYEATYSTSDDEQELLAQAVDSGRRALLDGDDARTAVIACYLAMETSLAASGVARLASDSPQDLLERAGAGGLLTGGAADALTALFREARYSTHPMDDGHRDRAAAALAEIAAQLDRLGRAEAATAEATP